MNPFRKNNQLSIFVTAGFPQLDSLPSQIQFLEANGVDFIEVGIPFSDPMADGPTIQESSNVALQNGMSVSLMFEQLSKVETSIPLVIMSYFNPILHYGLERFLESCNQVKVDHVIIPDISLEVYERLYRSNFEKYGVTLCFLITPKTPSERISKMSTLSSDGFLYLVSSNMTTGTPVLRAESRSTGSISLNKELSRIRAAAGDTPLMIGFGIKSREDVLDVHQKANGAIIGSAYIRALSEGRAQEFISSVSVPELQNP